MCVCVCVCMCVRACVRACVCVCGTVCGSLCYVMRMTLNLCCLCASVWVGNWPIGTESTNMCWYRHKQHNYTLYLWIHLYYGSCASLTFLPISLPGIEGGGLASGFFPCPWEEAALEVGLLGGVWARTGCEAGGVAVGGSVWAFLETRSGVSVQERYQRSHATVPYINTAICICIKSKMISTKGISNYSSLSNLCLTDNTQYIEPGQALFQQISIKVWHMQCTYFPPAWSLSKEACCMW